MKKLLLLDADVVIDFHTLGMFEKMQNSYDLYITKEVLKESKYYPKTGRKIPIRISKKVAVIDFGVKYNILRRLVDVGSIVRVFPYSIDISEIEAFAPDGILLSNGPGDPAAVTGAVETIQHFLGKKPMFGICLGHQLMALANGGTTYKMKFGHRGINHPVGDDPSGRVQVSVHNHGFAVSDDPLPDGAKLTLRSLNDDTVEGLEYPDKNAFSVQFHPEASPGPHDSSDIFIKFRELMEQNAGKN